MPIIPLEQVEEDAIEPSLIPFDQVEEDAYPAYSGPTLGSDPIGALTSADWWLTAPNGKRYNAADVPFDLLSKIGGSAKTLAKDVFINAPSALFDAVISPSAEKIEKVIDTTGNLAAGGAGWLSSSAAGASAGAALAPFTFGASIPLGTVAGGLLGAAGGDYLYNKAKQVPGMLADYLGATNPILNKISDAPTTMDQDAARYNQMLEQGASTYLAAELGASGINAAAKSAPAVTKYIADKLPATSEAKVRAKVGEMLADNIDPAILEQALKQNKKDLLGPSKSTAEILDSPELATYEQQLGINEPTKYNAAQAFRDAERERLLKSSVGGNDKSALGSPKEVLGDAVQTKLSEYHDLVKGQVQKLYDAIPEREAAPIRGLKYSVGDTINKYYGLKETGIGVPGDIARLIDPIKNPKNKTLTIQELQRLRSQFNDIQRVALRIGENDKAAVATEIKQAIADTIDRAPAGATEWQKANKAYALYADLFKNKHVKDLLDLDASKVADKVIASPEHAKAFIKMSFDDPDIIRPVRENVINQLLEKTDAQKLNFIKNKRSQLKTLFKDDYSVIQAVEKDISSRIQSQASANRTRGSNTALKQEDVIGRALKNKAAESDSWLRTLAKGGAFGSGFYALTSHPVVAAPLLTGAYLLNKMAKKSGELVRGELYDSLMNPKRALENLQKYKTKSTNSVSLKQIDPTIVKQIEAGGVATNSKKTDNLINRAYDKALITMGEEPLEKPEAPIVISGKRIPKSALVEAVIKQESGGNPQAVSKVGATGLMQIMPATAKEIAADLGVKDYDLKDPEINRMFGEHYLTKLIKMFKGDHRLALAAYNAGQGRVRKWIQQYGPTWDDISKGLKADKKFSETVNYVPSILAKLNKITKDSELV